MKILAFSDLHRDVATAAEIVNASKDADVVVGAGDFATHLEGAEETISILSAIKAPTILVSGNHDQHDDLQALCSNWHSCHVLHGTSVAINGHAFFGLGCEVGKPSDLAWNQVISETEAEALLAPCPNGAILVTHTPPVGYCDLQRDGSHEGSKAVLDTIRTRAIRLHLCGHIHNAWGMSATIGQCNVYNLGPTVNWFEV